MVLIGADEHCSYVMRFLPRSLVQFIRRRSVSLNWFSLLFLFFSSSSSSSFSNRIHRERKKKIGKESEKSLRVAIILQDRTVFGCFPHFPRHDWWQDRETRDQGNTRMTSVLKVGLMQALPGNFHLWEPNEDEINHDEHLLINETFVCRERERQSSVPGLFPLTVMWSNMFVLVKNNTLKRIRPVIIIDYWLSFNFERIRSCYSICESSPSIDLSHRPEQARLSIN